MYQVSSSLPQDNPGIKAFGSLNFPPVKILVLLFALLIITVNVYHVLNMCQALNKALTFIFFLILLTVQKVRMLVAPSLKMRELRPSIVE